MALSPQTRTWIVTIKKSPLERFCPSWSLVRKYNRTLWFLIMQKGEAGRWLDNGDIAQPPPFSNLADYFAGLQLELSNTLSKATRAPCRHEPQEAPDVIITGRETSKDPNILFSAGFRFI